jgi:hypothetical protein
MRRDANLLTRFWFEFDRSTDELRRHVDGYGAGWGCGVTAYSYEDALNLLRPELFQDEPIPPILRVVENVDVSTLEAGHVRPNMGVCIWRGIWFPNITSSWAPR